MKNSSLKRKIMSLVLAIILTISLLPSTILTASAVTAPTINGYYGSEITIPSGVYTISGKYTDGVVISVRLRDLSVSSKDTDPPTYFATSLNDTVYVNTNYNTWDCTIPANYIISGHHYRAWIAAWGDVSGSTSSGTGMAFYVSAEPIDKFTSGYNFWLQNDTNSDWYNVIYGIYCNPTPTSAQASTIGVAGCGLFAVKNALWKLGFDISVDDLHKYACWSGARGWKDNNGNRVYNGTRVGVLLKYLRDNDSSPIKGKITVTTGVTNVGKVRTHVQNGGVAIVNVKSSSGHFMAIVGYNSSTGKFLIQDSAPNNGKGRGDIGSADGSWISPSSYTIQVENYILIGKK